VTIRSLEIDSWDDTELRIDVACSKGTYIRVLAEDIGRALGCGATLAALRRTRVGRFALDQAVSLDALHALEATERVRHLLPADALLAGLPSLGLDADQAERILQGQAVHCATPVTPGLVRLYGPGAGFLGVAEATSQGRLLPRRLLSTALV
jgi:tRNA pseudouridine55 synthase